MCEVQPASGVYVTTRSDVPAGTPALCIRLPLHHAKSAGTTIVVDFVEPVVAGFGDEAPWRRRLGFRLRQRIYWFHIISIVVGLFSVETKMSMTN